MVNQLTRKTMKDVMINIEAIKIESPIDKIIKQLKHLITSGHLKPGDRLPPERVLAEKFGVGRSFVREAILKLEFYGLLKTSPQSGTYVSGYSLKIMDSILNDIINFNKDDFASLIETRYIMEVQAARLAAERRSEHDLNEISEAIQEYNKKVLANHTAVDEDMLFHILVARSAKNPILESMLVIIVPDLIKNIVDKNICADKRSLDAVEEHVRIFEAIREGNPDKAEKEMAFHLNGILQASKTMPNLSRL